MAHRLPYPYWHSKNPTYPPLRPIIKVFRRLSKIHSYLDKCQYTRIGYLRADQGYTIYVCDCGRFYCKHGDYTEIDPIWGIANGTHGQNIAEMAKAHSPITLIAWYRYRNKIYRGYDPFKEKLAR